MSVSSILFEKPSWKQLFDDLTPDPTESKRITNAFEEVKQVASSVGEVFLCGSTGKGTDVRGKADIDVVVVTKDALTPANHSEKLKLLEGLVKKHPNKFTQVKPTVLAVQFSFDNVEVDLLPAAARPAEGPIFFSSVLKTAQERQVMAATASTLQRDFIRGQPSLYKNLVRVAKHWRGKEKWIAVPGDGANYPNSYLLELLMLKAYQQHSVPSLSEPSTLDEVFRTFLTLIAQADEKTLLVWNAHYDQSVVNAVLLDSKIKKELLPSEPPGPLVLDPANPTTNVASRLRDWEPLRRYATQSLQKLSPPASALQEELSNLKLEHKQTKLALATLERKFKRFVQFASAKGKWKTITFGAAELAPFKNKDTPSLEKKVMLCGVPLEVQLSSKDSYLSTALFMKDRSVFNDLLESGAFSAESGLVIDCKAGRNNPKKQAFLPTTEPGSGFYIEHQQMHTSNVYNSSEIVVELSIQ